MRGRLYYRRLRIVMAQRLRHVWVMDIFTKLTTKRRVLRRNKFNATLASW